MKLTSRESLALSRTVMANERTLLSYLRTGIAFAISGAGVLRFIQDGIYVLVAGWLLILLGICFSCFGVYHYHKLKNALKNTGLTS